MFVFFDATQEGVRENPDGADTLLKTSLLTSASPYSTLYLYTRDQSLLFMFYIDQNFFHVRTVADPTTFAANYNSPTVISLPETGYQCACLNSDDSIIYVLLPSGALKSYDTANNNLLESIATVYTGVTNCFYDNSSYAIAFVTRNYPTMNTGSTSIAVYQLSTGN